MHFTTLLNSSGCIPGGGRGGDRVVGFLHLPEHHAPPLRPELLVLVDVLVVAEDHLVRLAVAGRVLLRVVTQLPAITRSDARLPGLQSIT